MRDSRILLAMLLVAPAGCANNASDADCTPEESSFAASEDCIYGSDRGPLAPVTCEPLLDAPTSDPPFSAIHALMTEEVNAAGEPRGACTQAICHGNAATAAGDIFFSSDPEALYATLVDTIGVTVRRPYVVPGDPEATWMHCNMRLPADGGVGQRMPQTHFLTDEDYALLESWILSGAEGP